MYSDRIMVVETHFARVDSTSTEAIDAAAVDAALDAAARTLGLTWADPPVPRPRLLVRAPSQLAAWGPDGLRREPLGLCWPEARIVIVTRLEPWLIRHGAGHYLAYYHEHLPSGSPESERAARQAEGRRAHARLWSWLRGDV